MAGEQGEFPIGAHLPGRRDIFLAELPGGRFFDQDGDLDVADRPGGSPVDRAGLLGCTLQNLREIGVQQAHDLVTMSIKFRVTVDQAIHFVEFIDADSARVDQQEAESQ